MNGKHKEILVNIGFLAVIVLLAIGGDYRSSIKAREVCRDTNDVRTYITNAINRGLKTLPTLQYYKDHPDELKKQIEELNRQKHDLKPRDC